MFDVLKENPLNSPNSFPNFFSECSSETALRQFEEEEKDSKDRFPEQDLSALEAQRSVGKASGEE